MMNKEKVLQNTIQRCREQHLILPTYKQMRNPELIPQKIKDKLKGIGLWDLNSLNLFRINWKNEPVKNGGSFGGVNYIELPTELTGIKAKVILLVGKYFPTGAHKVGATLLVNSTQQLKKHFGHQQEIIVAEALTILIYLAASLLPYFHKVCRKNVLIGYIKLEPKYLPLPAQRVTLKKYTIR